MSKYYKEMASCSDKVDTCRAFIKVLSTNTKLRVNVSAIRNFEAKSFDKHKKYHVLMDDKEEKCLVHSFAGMYV